MEEKPSLNTVNSHITCTLCKGYVINATVVPDCLHTFCKSCLIKNLEENTANSCPECGTLIHKIEHLRFDRTLQSIVDKIVPGLTDNEVNRERQFYQTRSRTRPETNPNPAEDLSQASEPSPRKPVSVPLRDRDLNPNYVKPDEKVMIILSPRDPKEGQLVIPTPLPPNLQYLRVCSKATVNHVKRFLALRMLQSVDRYNEIQLFMKDHKFKFQLLWKDHTLQFLCLTQANPPEGKKHVIEVYYQIQFQPQEADY